MKAHIPWVVLTAAIAAGACTSEDGCLRLTQPLPLLERPYPLEYTTSTHPQPNRVLRTLASGEYAYQDEEIGKDYLAFDVRLPDGTRGYVIYGAGVDACESDPQSGTEIDDRISGR